MENLLKLHLQRRRNGEKVGICSVCSANPFVLEAALEHGKENDSLVLIEATANQVNQFGGYTGKQPVDFINEVYAMADAKGFPREKLILGGDHLGPLTWQKEPEESAMAKAETLVKLFVLAGYTKIHIDTSMRVADDDPNAALDVAVVARRSARLAKACKEAYEERKAANPDAVEPVYVVGSEVPIPGGAQEPEEGVQVTSVADFKNTVSVFKAAYDAAGLQDVWERVVAVVVQPGVEFSDDAVEEYDREKAADLIAALEEYPQLVFEGHSTDYQQPKAFVEMVDDGIAILKVGPALTFEVREALYLLECMEKELCVGGLSDFRRVLDDTMLNDGKYWQKYYHGTEKEIALKRAMSYSDRCRYYMGEQPVVEAIDRLIANLSKVNIPLSMLKQYMPLEYAEVRAGRLAVEPAALVKAHVRNCLDQYHVACVVE